MFKKSPILRAAIAVTAALSSTNSSAAENYSGSDCIRRSGGAIAYDFSGAIQNTSTTQSSFVLCHVPHTDFDGLLNAGEIDSGFVDTVDLNNGSDVRCRFRSQSIRNNGTIWQSATAMRRTSGFGTQKQRLSLGSVGENGSSSYVLACEIPPATSNGRSKVFMYRVNQ